MAMDISRLAADLLTRFKARWRTEPGSAADENSYLAGLATDIATAVITEITGHAKCSGNDSNGDSHPNVGIV